QRGSGDRGGPQAGQRVGGHGGQGGERHAHGAAGQHGAATGGELGLEGRGGRRGHRHQVGSVLGAQAGGLDDRAEARARVFGAPPGRVNDQGDVVGAGEGLRPRRQQRGVIDELV